MKVFNSNAFEGQKVTILISGRISAGINISIQ